MDKETISIDEAVTDDEIKDAIADAEARLQIISDAQEDDLREREDDLREREDDESREEEAKVGLDRTGDS